MPNDNLHNEVADYIEKISLDSKIEAMHNMFNLTSNLKQNVPLHGYIDKVASTSPYYKGTLTNRRNASNESK